MNLQLSKRDILKKTAQYGSFTLLSRILALFRDILIGRFFGIGALSDAFIMSFRLPNFFRQIFAEGALNASFLPTFVKTVKEGRRTESNGLLTVSLLVFGGTTLLMYIFVLFKTELVIKVIAPGFTQEQIDYAIPFLRILFPFLFFVSTSTLFAGVLQAINCFSVPSAGPAIWNVFFLTSLLLAIHWHLSPTFVCFGILSGGGAWAATNAFFYFKYGFKFTQITPAAWNLFKSVISRFLPGLLGAGIVELNFFIGNIVASFLPKGNLTLLYLASRFMNLPLGIFAVALSNILLSHFSRVVLYAPRRLNFYILETTKLMSWVVLPTILFLIFVSKPLFASVLLAKSSDPGQACLGAGLLTVYLTGLLFLSLNKILLSIFYSMKDTRSTMIASSFSAVINICCDVGGMLLFGAYGIAGAASISGFAMTIICFHFLKKKHKFHFYTAKYLEFLLRYSLQLIITSSIFYLSFKLIVIASRNTMFSHFFSVGLGYWIVTGMLALLTVTWLFFSRKYFGIKLHFLDS